jgi:Zn-dependent metalloprotease
MNKRDHRSLILSIIPPHMLDQIARNGNKAQREWALDTLAVDHSIRSVRLSERPILRALRGAAPGRLQRTIYSANHTTDLPGTVVRTEGQGRSADIEVNEAYNYLGATYDLYWDAYHRDSIDDAGMPLVGVVHYGKKYDNAFWDGAEMVFGDGDGKLFNRFTIAPDVVGHELTHGVTEHEANLAYFNQAGALNESVSDVFGSLVKQYLRNQTAGKADWLIGAGLLAKGVKGKALRSMAAPGTAYNDPVLGKDPQPAHMKDYVHTTQDNGGVHINSGKSGRIWYDTICDPRLKTTAGFAVFAKRTVSNATHLYGATAKETKAVHDAWRAVGVAI